MLVFWNILLLTKTTYQNIQLLFKSFNYSHKLLDYDQLRSLVHLIMIFIDENNEISFCVSTNETKFRESTKTQKICFAKQRTKQNFVSPKHERYLFRSRNFREISHIFRFARNRIWVFRGNPTHSCSTQPTILS